MNKPVVSFFQLDNGYGRELKRLFDQDVASRLNLEVKPFLSKDASPSDFWNALTSSDFIIVDSSIEEENNYAIATPLVYQDNLLIVSRTPLPINYFGVRQGGVPKYFEIKSNQSIIEWLFNQIKETLSSPNWVAKQPTSGLRSATKILSIGDGGLEVMRSKFREEGQIFISYRSRYFNAVQHIAEQVRKQGKTVFLLPPGELVYENELLTKMQHWLLSTLIDERVKAAQELWIYNTEDYLNSWWTQAELVTIAYNFYQRKPVPKVRLLNPKKTFNPRKIDESVVDAPNSLLPVMNKPQWRKMERLYAQTDPSTMSPEALFTFDAAKRSFFQKIPFINRYINDEVWSREFWFQPLLPCVTCKSKDAPKHIDIDKFLKVDVPGLHGLSEENLVEDTLSQQLLQQGGKISCPMCSSIYRLTPDNSRYIWVSKASVGNTKPLIERPVWRVEKVN
ncbi:hypothetical protein NIES2135_67650 (plasmid) [Leptolyngbya boryana NIES-2135]|jgi:hypothetical protein|uniref:TIR domain-containing protein n=1 Tax=Leptolyngbya boryana NIES-2135 TaxID=1973484 RepID=A0A1Z4JTB9_LEPBY|nr:MULTISPECIES: hypothetical protein [Leptolyngbya]BAY59888.1 hypothetical protein NIES2135_67650 [Leptolyngbya boryana NIES-2135]MBD2369560.1 hypothetical protein [Leptolyngbya sp. FACHB-161]MBD2375995.1 hypothetical protein [Leptolyngbya sp. FACHB-238]MBD2400271.1 hypothetical protein [Leptolyngbya sp. FACHB-239]MBD2406813.1 hypothetical protein [Leptolyngbya sp. FACHB-402]